MKKILSLLFLTICSLSYGQKQLAVGNYSASDVFPETVRPVIKLLVAEADIPQALSNEADYPSDISLVLFHKIQSRALTHYHYHLYKDGVKIFGARAHVGMDKDNKIRVCEIPVLPSLISSQPFPAAGISEDVKAYVGAKTVVGI